ncbi:malonic semialdehyde reductase [Sphingomonas sp. 37zxx]|uniref:malonic semialdehyde reductase n=1 Tax=Sphingomonas sp. 37zxx TaxID=1550073 RepID=UPI00053BFA57|nr:malonic semialdehyde reductase [Sphingomonas sp. 37zxx]
MAGMLDDAALDTIFRAARTYNGFTDAPFTQGDARAIYDLVKMGPTSANQQPSRFVWCLDQASRDTLAGCASEGNADKIRKAPAAVVIGMDEDFHEQLPWLFPHTDAKAWFAGDPEARKLSALRNGSLQGAYLIIAARALGWDSGPMSGFNADKVNAAFFADQPKVKVNFIATLGKGDPSSIFDRSPRPEFDVFNRIA